MSGKYAVEALQSLHLLSIAQLGFTHCVTQHLDGLVIGLAVYRVGYAVLATVGKAVASWVTVARSLGHE
jgi:hypothetical protein